MENDEIQYKRFIEDTVIVIPSYNSSKTIKKTVFELFDVGFRNIIIGDDASLDLSQEEIKSISDVDSIFNEVNLGYGGNQKVLYNKAIELGYKFIVMVHGDNQYNPYIVPSMCWLLYTGDYDIVMGSRIIGGHPLKNGMPFYKYFFNRVLTYFQNIVTGYKLSEYHSGLRAYKVEALKSMKFENFSNDFIFDNQLLLEAIKQKKVIGEVSCQTKYTNLTSSISFKKSVIYGTQIIKNTFFFLFEKSRF